MEHWAKMGEDIFEHHVDLKLTLGRHVFNWLQFIANCYNFIPKVNTVFSLINTHSLLNTPLQ